MREAAEELTRLLEIMRRLRDPETGCPWDIVQTFETIAPYTIEEAHEVADAIARGAWDELRGELGDLLLQVVYHARMAEERGLFDFAEVARAIADKMIARHPHVFGSESRDKTPEQQTRDWEAIKAAERARSGAATGTLAGVALGLPALTRALKLQRRAARVGFDWPDRAGVRAKLDEELAELDAAIAGGDAGRIGEEIGDVLFSVVNLARHLGVDPEEALRAANRRFTARFEALERALAAEGRRPDEVGLEELERRWQAAKASLAAGGGQKAE
ncbi:MAG: nucleoside triphosphate pyrophosphohydrolase [Alphaproteobacteria bacterium]|nr:MAG: nucleoside triphosphate pyrophosphohydrolase [Alphaproteobacteria bacterium]